MQVFSHGCHRLEYIITSVCCLITDERWTHAFHNNMFLNNINLQILNPTWSVLFRLSPNSTLFFHQSDSNNAAQFHENFSSVSFRSLSKMYQPWTINLWLFFLSLLSSIALPCSCSDKSIRKKLRTKSTATSMLTRIVLLCLRISKHCFSWNFITVKSPDSYKCERKFYVITNINIALNKRVKLTTCDKSVLKR